MRRTDPHSDENRIPHSPTATGGAACAAHPADVDATAGDIGGVDTDVEVAGLVDQLCRVLSDDGRLDGLSDDGLRDRVARLRALEGQAAVAMATAVRVLFERGGTRADGASSTAAWIRSRTGRSARAASRMARLASSFPEMPATASALAAGELTDEAADVIVHAARDGRLGTPVEVEDALLPVAVGAGPEQVRAEVRRRTQQVDGQSMLVDEKRQHAHRKLSLTRRDDGMWQLYGLLPAETGNVFRTLLDVFDTPDPDGTPQGQRRRPDQRLADALTSAIDVALNCGQLPATGGVARPHISVLVDLATLATDLTSPDDPDGPVDPDDPVWARLSGADTAWGGTISPQAARRLCCDAGISRVVTAGTSQVLDVGRETRVWSPAQRRAINARDRCCRGPGCGRPIGWTHIHHLQWWRNGGSTDLDNGLALCHHCHRLIHDHGWHAELDVTTAAVTWTSPDRRRTHVTHPRRPA